nr:hypothetical protein [bacterium]
EETPIIWSFAPTEHSNSVLEGARETTRGFAVGLLELFEPFELFELFERYELFESSAAADPANLQLNPLEPLGPIGQLRHKMAVRTDKY